MFKKEKIKISIVIVVVSVFVFLFFWATPKTPQKELVATNQNKEIQTQNLQKIEPVKATLEISGRKYESEIAGVISVYELMEKLRNEGKINFKDKTYIGMGKFIEEINGVRGDGSKYWIYYVNGKKAQVGVSNYELNPGDIVSWRYEKDIN